MEKQLKPAKKTVLLILDGWGHGDKSASDAICHAKTPFIDSLYNTCPHAELRTDGRNVGLPEGQMGNSEVGHLNIGAGRIVNQDLVRINLAIEDGSVRHIPALKTAFQAAKAPGKKLHLMGLVSDGGVHSSQEHLHALVSLAKEEGVADVRVHAFTDGRDCDPKSGLGFLQKLEAHLQQKGARLASCVGRYYAMDRDKRWERIRRAYDLLVHGKGIPATNIRTAIEASYASGITDEFIEPIVMMQNNRPVGTIAPGDVVICFNFRTDRCREITMALTQSDFPEHAMHTLPLHYVTMTNYDKTFRKVAVLFDKDNLAMTLGEIISRAGLQQIRIAETEKYPHVTFFFSGGREVEFEGERRLMANSPKVATYDLKPEMSAHQITAMICPELEAGNPDFVCLNFANPDMVGHTGVFDAVVKAVETVDACAKKVVEAGKKHHYSYLIIADHGNADYLINPDGTPHTAHTLNPVPIFMIDKDFLKLKNGILADVAPTVLQLMGVPQPAEMTGKALAE